jgi:hypothetical protein
MTRKYITSTGKTKLLQLGFTDASTPFKYMALGNGNAAITENEEDFKEITGSNYSRVIVNATEDTNSQQISLSGVFAGNNYNPSDGGRITEIALKNDSRVGTPNDTFAIIEVPPIEKNSNISLKYTVVIRLL